MYFRDCDHGFHGNCLPRGWTSVLLTKCPVCEHNAGASEAPEPRAVSVLPSVYLEVAESMKNVLSSDNIRNRLRGPAQTTVDAFVKKYFDQVQLQQRFDVEDFSTLVYMLRINGVLNDVVCNVKIDALKAVAMFEFRTIDEIIAFYHKYAEEALADIVMHPANDTTRITAEDIYRCERIDVNKFVSALAKHSTKEKPHKVSIPLLLGMHASHTGLVELGPLFFDALGGNVHHFMSTSEHWANRQRFDVLFKKHPQQSQAYVVTDGRR